MTDSLPLSLYIHLPWCVSKCPYCDFNSHAIENEIKESQYIDALLADLESDLSYISDRQIISIFIGGGTPSLFSSESISDLLSCIRRKVSVADKCEVTLEANPESSDGTYFEDLHLAGITRISLGVQSFNDKSLNLLGRAHDSNQARRAITKIKQAGFNNFNIDVMFGLPNQTLEQGLNDIREAVDFSPSHISYYQLTLEPNTVFHKYPPALPAHESVFRLQEKAMTVLQNSGYIRYEVSAFGKIKCVHNFNYWSFGDYLGIGAGAHSKISLSLPNQVLRMRKTRVPKSYIENAMNGDCVAEKKFVDKRDLVFEFLMNVLRLKEGVPASLFTLHTGLSKEYLYANLKPQIMQGHLSDCLQTDQIKTIDQFYPFLDQILEDCLPAE